MLGIVKYLPKIYEIKWIFDDKDLSDLQQLLYVQFKKENEHYLIETIQYTYVDILLGLEDVDFKLTKTVDGITLKIMKI